MWKPIRMLNKCVTDITYRSKTTWFFFLLLDLNHDFYYWFKSINPGAVICRSAIKVLFNHSRSSNLVYKHSMQKSSVAIFMIKYCQYTIYWQNSANIILWQHNKIHRLISSLKRKCSFILKNDIKSCPSMTDPFFSIPLFFNPFFRCYTESSTFCS